MSNHSVIEHRANYHYIKIEEDYIAICQGKHKHCKAAILSILESWMNNKRTESSTDDDLYIYMSYPQFVKRMFHLYERNTVIKSLEELEQEGFIIKRPYVDQFNQETFEYRLERQVIQSLLYTLPEKQPSLGSIKVNGGSVKINDPHLKTDEGSFKNTSGGSVKINEGSFKNKRNVTTTKIPNIDTTQNDKEESIPASTENNTNASTLSRDAAPSLEENDDDLQDQQDTLKVLQDADIVPTPQGDEEDVALTHHSRGDLARVELARAHTGHHLAHSREETLQVTLTPPEQGADRVQKTDKNRDLSTVNQPVEPIDAWTAKAQDASTAQQNHSALASPAQSAPVVGEVAISQEVLPLPPPTRKSKKPAQEPLPLPKSDPREVQRRINEHRGYGLEEKVAKIREAQAVKSWCSLHTLDEYEQTMKYLNEYDLYWKKPENNARIGGLTIATETPKALIAMANLKTRPQNGTPVVHRRNLSEMLAKQRKEFAGAERA